MKTRYSNFELRTSLLNDRGNAFVLAITISVILFITMLTGIILIRQQVKQSTDSSRKSAALNVAEAGLDAAIWRLERNGTLPFETDGDGDNNSHTIIGSNTQGNYTAVVRREGGTRFQITSTGNHATSGFEKAIREDIHFIDLSQSIATLSSVNGGGTITGNVQIRGPFYTSGDLALGGTSLIDNLVGQRNPLLVGGNIDLSGNAHIGTDASPLDVFVEGTVNGTNDLTNITNVDTVVSRRVPEITLPDVVESEYLNEAQANDNAVFAGNVALGDSAFSFSHFNYSGGSNPTLTVEGVIFIDGNLSINTSPNQTIRYNHASGTRATIFVDGTITIDEELIADTVNGTQPNSYPVSRILAFVNEDQNPSITTDDDITITVAPGRLVQAFIYTSGLLRVSRQAEIQGSLIAKRLILENVPDLTVPAASAANNYPTLFPAENLALLIPSGWREVSP